MLLVPTEQDAGKAPEPGRILRGKGKSMPLLGGEIMIAQSSNLQLSHYNQLFQFNLSDYWKQMSIQFSI
jgi:hypothetical protein